MSTARFLMAFAALFASAQLAAADRRNLVNAQRLAPDPGANSNRSAGTQFWLAFPPNSNVPDAVFTVMVSGPAGTVVSVSIPRGTFDVNVTLSAGKVAQIEVPISPFAGRVLDQAVRVNSDAPVVVHGTSTAQGSNDAFLALPEGVLGTRYRLLHWPFGSGDAQVTVIATKDGTTVNDSQSIIELDAGQIYVIQASGINGALLTSSKPVGVIGGHECGSVPTVELGFCDHMLHMIPPLKEWRRKVLIAPFATRTAGDVVQVVAKKNGLTLVVDGEVKAIMETGDSTIFEIPSDRGTVISADGGFLATQIMKGYEADPPGREKDPSSLLLLGPKNYLSSYEVATVFNFGNYLNVIAQNDRISSMRLDGEPVPRANFTEIAKSGGYYYAQLSIAGGTHTVTAPKPFGLSVYGFGDATSYAYPAGAQYPVKPKRDPSPSPVPTRRPGAESEGYDYRYEGLYESNEGSYDPYEATT